MRFVIPASGHPDRTLPFLDRAAAAGAHFVGVTHPRGISNWSSFRNRLPFDSLPEWAAIRSLPLEEQRHILADPARRAVSSSPPPSGPRTRPAPVPRPARRTTTACACLTSPIPPWPTVNEVAAERGVDPVTAIIELSLESGFDQFFVQPLGPFDTENVGTLLAHPSVVMGFSDSGAHVSQMADASITSHMLAYWVRDRQTFPIERAVELMTSAVARAWGLTERGLIREGYVADLNVIEPATVAPSMPRMVADLPAGAKRIEQRSDGVRRHHRRRRASGRARRTHRRPPRRVAPPTPGLTGCARHDWLRDMTVCPR